MAATVVPTEFAAATADRFVDRDPAQRAEQSLGARSLRRVHSPNDIGRSELSGRSWPGVALPAGSDAYAVVEVDDAVLEPAFIEEFESRADVVRQGALAATHH